MYRFGKVLWRSDENHCISDEVLDGTYKIKDLKGGKVSVEDVLGRSSIKGECIKWDFLTRQVTSLAIVLQVMCRSDGHNHQYIKRVLFIERSMCNLSI